MSVLDSPLIEKDSSKLSLEELHYYYVYLINQRERISIEEKSTRARLNLMKAYFDSLEIVAKRTKKGKLLRKKGSAVIRDNVYYSEAEKEHDHLQGHIDEFEERLESVNELIKECKRRLKLLT